MTPSQPSQPVPQLPSLPQAAQSPPVFGQAMQPNQKPGQKSATPSFLGSATIASPGNLGGKKLVGQ